MSTRRLYLPLAQAVSPTWIYGTFGGVGQIVAMPGGALVLLNSDRRWQVLPNIYRAFGPGGDVPATADPVIMSSASNEAQASALLIRGSGTVDDTTLGTFVAPDSQSGTLNSFVTVGGIPQYAALPTGGAAASIGTPTKTAKLLTAGLFSYYYLAAATTAVGPVAAIDLATGLIDTTFICAALAINSGYGSTLAPPKVFSDGALLFGIHSLGLNAVTTYTVSFPAGLPSGLGTVTVITHVSAITPPIATYGATSVNGPFLISNTGAFASAFASGLFSWAQPVPAGAGLFLQDAVLARPTADPAVSGSMTERSAIGTPALSGSTVTILVTATSGSLSGIFNLIGEGGSTGGSFNTTVTGATTAAQIQTLFPDCAVTFVDTSSGGVLHVVVTLTLPTGATYFPFARGQYDWYGSGPAVPQTTPAASGGTVANYLELVKSDGSSPQYFVLPKRPISTAVAVNGSLICHVYNWVDPNNNPQWTITIPGVIRINVSLAYTLGTTHNGTFAVSSTAADATDCPVSIVPFGAGFAVALPYEPLRSGTGFAPLKYTFSPGATGAATNLYFGPIFLLSSAGAVDAAFDTAVHTNFFALSRTDGRRYGPFSLTLDSASQIRFGSYYMPGYFDPLATDPTPIDALGHITPIPLQTPLTPPGEGFNFNAFQAPQTGPGLEVFCATGSAGTKIFPT